MLELRIVVCGRVFTLDQVVAQLGTFDATREIGQLIETMIAKLDDLQGDVDLEDDDPSIDPAAAGEREEGILAPIYGLDQSEGPINFDQAHRDHMRSQIGPYILPVPRSAEPTSPERN